MSSPEYSPEIVRVLDSIGNALSGARAETPAFIEQQGNKVAPSGAGTLATGVQNKLIHVLLLISKELGLKENELEKVFDEVLKMIKDYQGKKGEV